MAGNKSTCSHSLDPVAFRLWWVKASSRFNIFVHSSLYEVHMVGVMAIVGIGGTTARDEITTSMTATRSVLEYGGLKMTGSCHMLSGYGVGGEEGVSRGVCEELIGAAGQTEDTRASQSFFGREAGLP